ncbi:DEAD/DEAH box helicase family protein [Albibacillus kandeliae]|uniref:DEAD/DEAH box helicase family protein n=1 Tax=Albibacillus kandeliae TaxID=2174228 RepID=UPI000D696848|nr:DEAD/DEAH box helicase family protein [Albibacillus kandeliae]
MIDFSKLSRPKSRTASVDPIEIFKKTPNTGGAPNDLWKGQADALTAWNGARTERDNLIILNTGAGKSIVGLMAAQSLVNEGVENVLFVCSTIDLVEQTAREAEKLGLNYTMRTGGAYSNDGFETGKSFCITTYQSLFLSLSPFKKFQLGGIIFDDAHVSERLIRDSLTVTVSITDHPELYQKLVGIIRPEFEKIKRADHLKFVVDEASGGTTLCPPMTAARNSAAIIEAFKGYKYGDHLDLKFPMIQLYEHLQCCAVYVSAREVEICPPFIPNAHFEHVVRCPRRIYLSATLDYPTDFIRAFGTEKVNRIEPDNDAGNGERVIILSSLLADADAKLDLAVRLKQESKVLVSVPSYRKAKAWKDLCVPPTAENFSAALNDFRKSETGIFCLVSRVDGIDLPQNTCRIMIIDGSPSGSNAQERYQVEALQMLSQNATKTSTRLTQLLGRINRGRSDYGAFIIYGHDLNTWCKNDRNIALLPSLIRKQFLLGAGLQEQIGKIDNVELVKLLYNILGQGEGKVRDKEWLKFYGETIEGLEVHDDALTLVREREEKLAQGALAESEFMSCLWHGDTQKARQALMSVIDYVAPVDSKLAGWYDLWLGMTYELEGDVSSSSTHYSRARSRLTPRLNVPLVSKFATDHGELSTENPVQRKLADLNLKSGNPFSEYAEKLRHNIAVVGNAAKSSNEREEACRLIGELLGFETERPDNVYRKGPDVVWSSEETKELIAFELKTQKKEGDTTYKKDAIGQSLNHIEWLHEKYEGYVFRGVVVMGPLGVVSNNASPGDQLFLITPDEFGAVCGGFVARIDDLVGRTQLERWHMLKELGLLPEYQIAGLSAAFSNRLLKSLM